MKIRQQIPIEPGGQQGSRTEHPVRRTARPGCIGLIEGGGRPFAEQQLPAMTLLLPDLQQRSPLRLPQSRLDQQFHQLA